MKFDFDSPLTDLVVELNNLRDKQLMGSTPSWIFFQIKRLFQFVESLESARIEGNRTTLADYVAEKLSSNINKQESFLEIDNIEKTMEFKDKSASHAATISRKLN